MCELESKLMVDIHNSIIYGLEIEFLDMLCEYYNQDKLLNSEIEFYINSYAYFRKGMDPDFAKIFALKEASRNILYRGGNSYPED